MKKALITGITGQDGSYLAEFLLKKNYEVHGIIRRSSSFNTGRIDHLYQDPHTNPCLFLHYGDMADGTGLRQVLERIQPNEVYNLAAQSHVRVSFLQSEYTADIVATGTLRLLNAIRDYIYTTKNFVKFYQASSSEMFGNAPHPQTEETPFCPCSPYAVSKVAAHWHTINYRNAYNMFNCCGILFNHESPRRNETFVTRKITRALTRISLGLQDKLYLGNLEAKRDWGFAKDYVEAMWLILQQPNPDDYVIATEKSHTVQEFLTEAANYIGLDWNKYVIIDPQYYRPCEVNMLEGDMSKALAILDWEPKTTFKQLIHLMMDSDLELAKREQRMFSHV